MKINDMKNSSFETRKLISLMSDEGEFESLATSTLRISNPIYDTLCETGTNADGRTIPDPADGISYVKDESGRQIAIIVHHTITAKNKLRQKWLHPEDGDIAKSFNLFEGVKQKLPNTQRKLILTYSSDPTSALITDLATKAEELGMWIEVWSGARIANVLDISADGQWLRHKVFGKLQERLSADLATQISYSMIEEARPQANPAEFIKRELWEEINNRLSLEDGCLFLTGGSGVGKSVLCYDISRELLKTGGVCFVVSDQTLQGSLTFQEVLKRTFEAYAPSLKENNYTNAILECFDFDKVLVWIEDINRATAPVDLLRKITRWMLGTKSEQSDLQGTKFANKRLKIICPIWPEVISGLTRKEREIIEKNSLILNDYGQREGSDAVQKRAQFNGASLTILEAHDVAEKLNHDPLLIGLETDWKNPKPNHVIERYIDDELVQLSQATKFQKSEYDHVLLQLVTNILISRVMSPTWKIVKSWNLGSDFIDVLRCIIKASSLLRVNELDVLSFRHDRVRDYLLVRAIASDFLESGVYDEILTDPYFAKVVGQAAIMSTKTRTNLNNACTTPLLAFVHAFSHSVSLNHPSREHLFERCAELIGSEAFQQGPNSQRYAVNQVLAELDGEDVLSLLKASKQKCFARQEGMTRNGDVRAAASYCYSHEPTVLSSRRDRVLAHAKRKHGEKWVIQIGEFIADPRNHGKIQEGALYLAGELGHELLIEPLKARWRMHQEKKKLLTSGMLFAAVTCAAGRDNLFADQVVSAWSKLPIKDEEKEHSNPRFDVAEYGLRGGLRRHENDRLINYLIPLSDKFPQLKRSIHWLLRQIDHPSAVVHTARGVADVDIKIEGTKGFNVWASSFADFWGQLRDSHYRKMGSVSKEALLSVCLDGKNDIWFRKRAFDLWSARLSGDEVRYLAQNTIPGLEDRSLAARLRHGDQTAKPKLAEKILNEENDWYWLQFSRYVGTRGLEHVIDDLFKKRRNFASNKPKEYFRPDDILPELLGDRDDHFAFEKIKDNWDQVGAKKNYVIALLYMATPESLELVHAAIDAAEVPADLLKHLDMRIGIKVGSRPGIKRIEQLEAILPFMEFLSDLDRRSIWDTCNTMGWFDWRRNQLDQLIVFPEDRSFPRINESADFSWLDNQLKGDRKFRRQSHYWVKDRLEAGFLLDEIIERAERYVFSRNTEDAVLFLIDVLAEYGSRQDIERIEKYSSKGDNIKDEIQNAVFAVMLRSAE